MQTTKPTVLIIDDNEHKRYALARYLKEAGFEIWESALGEEGLSLAQKQPSVITLDVKLPDILGYEVSRRLRSDPKTASIPIIHISATFTTAGSKARGLNSGADAYLTGPVEPEELLATVNAMLRMRKAEATATELAVKWQATFDAISDAVLLLNPEGIIEHCNQAFAELVNKKGEEVVGCNVSQVASGGALDQSVYFHMAASHRRESTERRFNERWFKITADPLIDEEGRFRGGVLILSDVTESKRAENVSRQLAAIVESSEDAIVSTDLNGIVTSWNRGAQNLFGYKSEEIVGQPVTLLVPPDKIHEQSEILSRIRQGKIKHHFQTIRRRKDAGILEVSLSVSPVLDADGRIVGASKIVRDISEQKQSERKLAMAHQEAVTASQAKDSFIAALSHELRTPLSPILLIAAEGSENPELPLEIRNQFETIRASVELEARLIDDLLDITRITHGKLDLNLTTVDVHSLLAEATDTVRPQILSKRIVLTVKSAAQYSTCQADAVRLRQVFWNVLQNAVKFTPEGGKIDVGTSNSAGGEIVISISDTGIGLTEEEIGRIFNTFAQGEHSDPHGSHRFGGLGLGLAICKRLVELHSGTIRATSAGRNQGATFIITLPKLDDKLTAHPSDSGGAAPKVPGVSPLRILLVEDHVPTSVVLTSLLTRRGHEVRTADSVAKATALLQAYRCDLILCDIGLPDGTGFELMRYALANNENVQGIALTGYGMEQDIQKSRAAGFAFHLIKPVSIQSLEAALKALSPRPARPTDFVG